MENLYDTLKAVHAANGSDSLLDEALMLRELRERYSQDEAALKPVLWCLRQLVYYQMHADPDPAHARFSAIRFTRELAKKQHMEPEAAAEVMDAFILLADDNRNAEINQGRQALEKKMFESILDNWEGVLAGDVEAGRSGLERLCAFTPIAHYYAGRSYMEGPVANSEKMLEHYQAGAEKKNRDCLNALAAHYQASPSLPDHEALAIARYTEASKCFHPGAMCVMGVLQYHGYASVGKALIPSLYHLAWAARQGSIEARAFLAVHYKGESDAARVNNAAAFFTEATMPLDKAYYAVGRLYETGQCIIRDEELAKRCYNEALRYGSTQAAQALETSQNSLSLLPQEDDGLREKTATADARAALTNAAGAGDPAAICDLGRCYMYGIGFEKSNSVALSWFRRGAAKGSEDCARMLTLCNYAIASDYFEQPSEQRRAKGLTFVKAALDHEEHLSPDMQSDCRFFMAVACYEGIGTEKDPARAAEYMAAPLEAGYLKALLYMGRARLDGTIVPQDYAQAFTYYMQARQRSGKEIDPLIEGAFERYMQDDAAPPLPENLVDALNRLGETP